MTEESTNQVNDNDQTPDSPVNADAGKTFTADEVTAIVRERLNRQKGQHTLQLEAAKVDKQALEAAQQALDRYQKAFTKVLEDKRKGLPEPVLKLLDDRDPLEQLEWIAENAGTFAEPTHKGPPPSPKPGGLQPADVVEAKRTNPIYSL